MCILGLSKTTFYPKCLTKQNKTKNSKTNKKKNPNNLTTFWHCQNGCTESRISLWKVKLRSQTVCVLYQKSLDYVHADHRILFSFSSLPHWPFPHGSSGLSSGLLPVLSAPPWQPVGSTSAHFILCLPLGSACAVWQCTVRSQQPPLYKPAMMLSHCTLDQSKLLL